jgi:hypothetical protein
VNTLAKDWAAVGSALGEIEVIPPQALRWTEETEEIDETDEREDVEGVVWGEIGQAVDECRLLAPQTSNKLLFQLARELEGSKSDSTTDLLPSSCGRFLISGRHRAIIFYGLGTTTL